ncbi:hypothetical protein ACR9YC_01150 [Parasphingorhabdus sp. DH2-15]|uniref:hypothetical protein n=1 Tax=Parasphingorhabdus sp. DH2-15 TaxID=3444112 RepID=UPI003F683C35
MAACTTPKGPETDNFGVAFDTNIPADVRSFIVQRQACDHFRSEPRGDDAARDAFLDSQIAETCIGTDKKLAVLKLQYQDDKQVTAILREFEEDIET